jgi:transposase
MKISRVGVDLAKNVFQIHGADAHGNSIWKRKLNREKWIEAVCTKAPDGCEIGMEACAGAHHWAGDSPNTDSR